MKTTFFLLPFLFALPLQAASAAFSDVTEDTEYRTAIEYLAEKGIINGYGDGRFGPDNTLRRAELLKILLEAKDDFVKPEAPTAKCFPDVETFAWYAPYVCYAKDAGMVQGFPDGTFRPNKVVSFVEVAKMVVETLGLEKKPGGEYWYEGYVMTLIAHDTVPKSVTYFEQHLNRAEMAYIMSNQLQYNPKEDEDHSEDFTSYKYMQQNSLLLSGGIYEHVYESIEENPAFKAGKHQHSYTYGFGTVEVTGYMEVRSELNGFCNDFQNENNTCEMVDRLYFIVPDATQNADFDRDYSSNGVVPIGCSEDNRMVFDIFAKKSVVETDNCSKWHIPSDEFPTPKPTDICNIDQGAATLLKTSSPQNPVSLKLTFLIDEGGGLVYGCRTTVIRIEPISFSN